MTWKELASVPLLAMFIKYNYTFWVAIIILAILRGCFANTDTIDDAAKVYGLAGVVRVIDKDANGFDIYFKNTPDLTEERIELLTSSDKVTSFFKRAAAISATVDTSLLYADPYDVLLEVQKIGIPDSIKAYYVIGCGSGKHEVYLRSNPSDSNLVQKTSLRKPNQGMVFLTEPDIDNYSASSSIRAYRYKDSNNNLPIYAVRDEQFTHISAFEAR